MNKEKIKGTCKHYFTGDGLFHNVDGSVSDRWVLAYVIEIVNLFVILVWAFGQFPKSEYAFKLLNMNTNIVLPILITGQTAENYFRNRDKKEKREGEIKEKEGETNVEEFNN
jgi:hypothetical protein